MIDCCYCLFEQSGTFKNAFKKLGIPAMDYDIQNNFGETDFQMDLFEEIKFGFAKPPDIIDTDRRRRGDYYKKPTAFWFFGFEPTFGESYQLQKEERFICKQPKGKKAGLCGEERSLISPDYARNFICDFILGKKQDNTKLDLFGGK